MERPSTKATRWIKFIGGRNLIFTLFAGVLLGALIFVFYHVRFIFNPLLIIFKTIFAPILLALILYYLLDPIVNFFEKKGIKRIFSILGIAIVLLLLVAAFSVWAVPKIYSQTANLMNDFPRHVDSFNLTLQDLVAGTLLKSPIEEVFEIGRAHV